MAKTLEKRLDEGQGFKRAVDNLNQSYYRRLTTLNKRIRYMLKNEHSYFITFTLRDDCLNFKKNTIERKIKEALNKSGASGWLLNRDYGSINGRLHYHAVASYNERLEYTDIVALYGYGSIDLKLITRKDIIAIRNYLVNHSIKQTASKIMMSRL